MRPSVLHAGAVLFVAVALSGCGGGGGGTGSSGPGDANGNYFPVDANSRWIYASTGAAAPTVVTRSATQAVGAQTGQVFDTVDGLDGSSSTDIYVVSETGVKDYAPAGADPISAALSGIRLMTFPIEIGAVYPQADVTVDSGIDFDGDGRSDRVRVQATLTVVGIESLSTPVGPAEHVATYDFPLAVRIVDIDGDGRADIVVSHSGWNAIGIYLQQANGTLSAESRYVAPYGSFMPGQMAVGDIDRDGRPDVVIAGTIIRQLPNMPGPMALVGRSGTAPRGNLRR